jgi:hypothetical protein
MMVCVDTPAYTVTSVDSQENQVNLVAGTVIYGSRTFAPRIFAPRTSPPVGHLPHYAAQREIRAVAWSWTGKGGLSAKGGRSHPPGRLCV